MTDKFDFVEVQGSGEENVFSAAQLEGMVAAARDGISQLLELQKAALD
jgi:ribonuclease PH